MALRLIRAIRVHGVTVTMNDRVVGSRSATTGGAAITYGDDQNIKAIIGRAQTRSIPTQLGDVTETTRTIRTVTSLEKGYKITLNDGTYYVRDTPTQTRRKLGDTELLVYESVIVRDPIGRDLTPGAVSSVMTRLEGFLDNIAIAGKTILVLFEGFQEPLEELFVTGSKEVIFVIGKPPLSAVRFVNNEPAEYIHTLPVTIMALLLEDITQAETQMRNEMVTQKVTYEGTGDYFTMDSATGRSANIKIGQRVIFRSTYNVKYRETI